MKIDGHDLGLEVEHISSIICLKAVYISITILDQFLKYV